MSVEWIAVVVAIVTAAVAVVSGFAGSTTRSRLRASG